MANKAVAAQTVNLSGKQYVMVGGRVLLAHQDNREVLNILSDVVYEDDKLIRVKATVLTRKGTFQGHAESDKIKGQGVEKQSPLEVAETSAIGRALGFAGYAIEGGIASAEEMQEAQRRETTRPAPVAAAKPASEPAKLATAQAPANGAAVCADCNLAIAAYASGDKTLQPSEIAAMTERSYGRALCVPCSRKVGSPKKV